MTDSRIGSVFVTLTMHDGSVFSSAEGEEMAVIDDTIMIVSRPRSLFVAVRLSRDDANPLAPSTRPLIDCTINH